MPKTIFNVKRPKVRLFKPYLLTNGGLMAWKDNVMYNTGMAPTDLDAQYQDLVNKVPAYDAHMIDHTNPHVVTALQIVLDQVADESKATMFTSPTFTGATLTSTGNVRIADPIPMFSDLTVFATAGMFIDRGTEPSYTFEYDEAKGYPVSGYDVTFYRVAYTDDTPTDAIVPLWDGTKYATAGGTTLSTFVTIDQVVALTNKTLANPVFTGTVTCTGVFASAGLLYLDFDNGLVGVNTAGAPSFELEVREGTISATSATAKNARFWNTPQAYWSSPTISATTIGDAFYIGANADARLATAVSGYGFRNMCQPSGDCTLLISPRIGYTGVGTAAGQSSGYPSTTQLTTAVGISITKNMLGIGTNVPVRAIDLYGTANIAGRIVAGGQRTVKSGSMVRAGNAVELQTDGTIDEVKRAMLTMDVPYTQLSIATGNIVGSQLLMITSKRLLFLWHAIAGSSINYTVIGIDGSTLSSLNTGAIAGTTAGTGTYIRAVVMPCTKRGLVTYVVAGAQGMCAPFLIGDDNTIALLQPAAAFSNNLGTVTLQDVVYLDCTTGIITYHNDSEGLCARAFYYPQDTITLGAIAPIEAAELTPALPKSGKISTTKAILTYRIAAGYRTRVLIDTAMVVTFGAATAMTGSTANTQGVCALSATTVMYAASRLSAPNYQLFYNIGTIDGANAIAYAGEVVIATTVTAYENVALAKLKDNAVSIFYYLDSGAGMKPKYAVYDPLSYTTAPFISSAAIIFDDSIGGANDELFTVPLSQYGDAVVYHKKFSGGVWTGLSFLTSLNANIMYQEATVIKEIQLAMVHLFTAFSSPPRLLDTGSVVYGVNNVVTISMVGEDMVVGRIFDQQTYMATTYGFGQMLSAKDGVVVMHTSGIADNISMVTVVRTKGDSAYNVSQTSSGLNNGVPIISTCIAPITESAFLLMSNGWNGVGVFNLRTRVVYFDTYTWIPAFYAVTNTVLANVCTGISLTRMSTQYHIMLGTDLVAGTLVSYRYLNTNTLGAVTVGGAATIAATSIKYAGNPASDGYRIICYPYIGSSTTNLFLLPLAVSNTGVSVTAGAEVQTAIPMNFTQGLAPTACHISNGMFAVSGTNSTTGAQFVCMVFGFRNRADTVVSLTVLQTITLSIIVNSLGPHWVVPFNDEYILSIRSWNTISYFSLIKLNKEQKIIGVSRETNYGGETTLVAERNNFNFDFYTAGKTYVVDLDSHTTPTFSKYVATIDEASFATGIQIGSCVYSNTLAINPTRVAKREVERMN